MRLKSRLHRLSFALWLGIAALAAGAVEQQQLASNVLEAASAEIRGGGQADAPAVVHTHVMPDGRVMTGSMSGGDADAPAAGGHTHKGHSDCDICGALAAMAAFTTAAAPLLPVPRVRPESSFAFARAFRLPAAPRAPYASRAPPSSC